MKAAIAFVCLALGAWLLFLLALTLGVIFSTGS